jgi:hypothetical protein
MLNSNGKSMFQNDWKKLKAEGTTEERKRKEEEKTRKYLLASKVYSRANVVVRHSTLGDSCVQTREQAA